MTPLDFMVGQPIADSVGWVDVDRLTLQHKKYGMTINTVPFYTYNVIVFCDEKECIDVFVYLPSSVTAFLLLLVCISLPLSFSLCLLFYNSGCLPLSLLLFSFSVLPLSILYPLSPPLSLLSLSFSISLSPSFPSPSLVTSPSPSPSPSPSLFLLSPSLTPSLSISPFFHSFSLLPLFSLPLLYTIPPPPPLSI